MLEGRNQTHVDGVPRKIRAGGDYSIIFLLEFFLLSFIAIGTDAVEDLLRNSAYPYIYASIGEEKGVPKK